MWQAEPSRNAFMQYSPTRPSRVQRIYKTKEFTAKRVGEKTVAAAFSDHLAVILQLSVIQRGRGFWKLNASLLDEEVFREKLRQQRKTWRQQKRFYPDWAIWRERYTKKNTRLFCIKEGAERRRDFMRMKNFYYECIYDVLRNTHPHGLKMTMLNRPKAKITTYTEPSYSV